MFGVPAEPAPFRTPNPLVRGSPDAVRSKWADGPDTSWVNQRDNTNSGPAVPARAGGGGLANAHNDAPSHGAAASSNSLSALEIQHQRQTHFFPVDPLERGQYASTVTVEDRGFHRDQLGSSFHHGPNLQQGADHDEDGAWVDELPSLAPVGTSLSPEHSSWSGSRPL